MAGMCPVAQRAGLLQKISPQSCRPEGWPPTKDQPPPKAHHSHRSNRRRPPRGRPIASRPVSQVSANGAWITGLSCYGRPEGWPPTKDQPPPKAHHSHRSNRRRPPRGRPIASRPVSQVSANGACVTGLSCYCRPEGWPPTKDQPPPRAHHSRLRTESQT